VSGNLQSENLQSIRNDRAVPKIVTTGMKFIIF